MQNLRKKRQESNVQLRKGKREEQVLKRRNINLEDLNTSPLKELNCQVSCVWFLLWFYIGTRVA